MRPKKRTGGSNGRFGSRQHDNRRTRTNEGLQARVNRRLCIERSRVSHRFAGGLVAWGATWERVNADQDSQARSIDRLDKHLTAADLSSSGWRSRAADLCFRGAGRRGRGLDARDRARAQQSQLGHAARSGNPAEIGVWRAPT